MTPTATLTKPKTDTKVAPDFDQIEADLNARLAALREQRQSHALDSLSDKGAREQLEAVERDLAATEGELGRLSAARAEQERRDEVAAREAKNAAELAALDKAAELQVQREAVAAKIDTAIKAFVRNSVDYFDLSAKQANELSLGGRKEAARSARSTIGYKIEAALANALIVEANGRLPMLERMPMIAGAHRQSLVDAERAGRPIEPANGKADA